MADPQALILHIVVLMLENRSFDHMLGYLGTPNGLTGAESNPVDPTSPASPEVPVSNAAAWTGDLDIDPSHTFEGVNVQLFGSDPAPAQPPARTNHGFVLDYARQPGNTAAGARGIMKCFAPDRVPVLSTLAREFAVCDRWFSSVPSQTWPNRFFAHCGWSGGFLDNKVRVYDMRTIYDNLSDAGIDWAIYFHDIPHSLALTSVRNRAGDHVKLFNQAFESDCRGGTLPSYSFIEPRYFNFLGLQANDEHPPHDIRLGEELIAKVYESLRASQVWKSTLLVVTSDEHGGVFDHVLPPVCPAPNFTVSSNPPFDFKRLGPRVPTVVVSPYIPKGTVDSTTDYDHTSILASAKVLFDLPTFLTERDASAGTFWHLLSDNYRSDTPEQLPRPGGAVPAAGPATASAMSDADVARSRGLASREALSEFQQSLVELANDLEIPEPPGARAARLALDPQDEHTAAVHVRSSVERYLETQRPRSR